MWHLPCVRGRPGNEANTNLYIYVCTGARVGHRLERAANMIIINCLLLLTIIDIHILTSLTYNSADLQACYLANIIYVVQLDS